MDQIDLGRLLPISKEIERKLQEFQRERPSECIVGKPVTKEMIEDAVGVVNKFFGRDIRINSNEFRKAYSSLITKGKGGTQSIKGKRSNGKRSRGKRSKGKRSKGKRSKGTKTHKRSQYGGVGTPPRALALTVALSRYTTNQLMFSHVVFCVTMVFAALWVFSEIPLSSGLDISSDYNSLYQLLLSMGLFSGPMCEETVPIKRFAESYMRTVPCTVSSRNVSMIVLPLLTVGGAALSQLILYKSKKHKIPIMGGPFTPYQVVRRTYYIGVLTVAEIFTQTESGRPTVCEEESATTSDASTLEETIAYLYQLLPDMYQLLPGRHTRQTIAEEERDIRRQRTASMFNTAKTLMNGLRDLDDD